MNVSPQRAAVLALGVLIWSAPNDGFAQDPGLPPLRVPASVPPLEARAELLRQTFGFTYPFKPRPYLGFSASEPSYVSALWGLGWGTHAITLVSDGAAAGEVADMAPDALVWTGAATALLGGGVGFALGDDTPAGRCVGKLALGTSVMVLGFAHRRRAVSVTGVSFGLAIAVSGVGDALYPEWGGDDRDRIQAALDPARETPWTEAEIEALEAEVFRARWGVTRWWTTVPLVAGAALNLTFAAQEADPSARDLAFVLGLSQGFIALTRSVYHALSPTTAERHQALLDEAGLDVALEPSGARLLWRF